VKNSHVFKTIITQVSVILAKTGAKWQRWLFCCAKCTIHVYSTQCAHLSCNWWMSSNVQILWRWSLNNMSL